MEQLEGNARRQEQVIWCAGFFDGEGCIWFCNPGSGNRHGNLAVQVGQRIIEPLYAFQELWDGTIQPPNHNRSTYLWLRYSRNAGKVLEEMLPWLRVKHSQAVLAIEYCTLVERVGARSGPGNGVSEEVTARRLAIAAEIKSLKRP